jgi:hypothetical protein
VQNNQGRCREYGFFFSFFFSLFVLLFLKLL